MYVRDESARRVAIRREDLAPRAAHERDGDLVIVQRGGEVVLDQVRHVRQARADELGDFAVQEAAAAGAEANEVDEAQAECVKLEVAQI
jgi:hypothetical protein